MTTEQVNVGSIRNIPRAIRAQPDPDAVHLVTVGSVAMTGSSLPPSHWDRVAHPIAPAIGDHYAVSKTEAERLVVESGLAHWVSLRQTFIRIPRLLSVLHPILFHQPVNTAFEFGTARDSGLLMANACESWVDAGFCRRVYNIGGGDNCRVGYIEYLDRVFNTFGLGTSAKIFERSWFALRNFHCHWFLDSGVLEGHLHFQRDGFNEYLAHVADHAPWYLKAGFAGIVPSRLVRVLLVKRIARRTEGPLHWIETDDRELIEAFFGSRAEWESIPGWDSEIPPSGPPQPLSHGFNDELPDAEIGLVHATSAAGFRSGECRAQTLEDGDLYSPLPWRCAFGHDFTATGYLVLRAGHWCPSCEAPPWNFDWFAAANQFFAQVWPVKATPDQPTETSG